jgi:GDP-L-fucose synthase
MTIKRVLVTGGKSMIGRAIVKNLISRNICVNSMSHEQCDLLNYDETYNYINDYMPDCVIHAAGWNGGIEWNKLYPATIYYRTALMALNVYQSCAMVSSVKKVLGLLASCSYPDMSTSEYSETELWQGKPNPTVECHGLSKRIIADFGRQVSKQYPTIKCVSCIVNNSYGPYDSFNPNKTKVVGALIKKIVEAKQRNLESIVCWGTGKPLREFIYSQDVGNAVVKCLLEYNNVQYPINITSGEEVSIKELTLIICDIVGYNGNVLWDTNKPDGQMKKSISNKKFQQLFPDFKFTRLRDGLQETIEWYINNKTYADDKWKGF